MIKVKKEEVSVLPMMPQELRYLIGSYAWEQPLHRLKSYQEFNPGSNSLEGEYTGAKLLIDAPGSRCTLHPVENILQAPSEDSKFLLALTPIEVDFFKHTLESHPNKFVLWQPIAKEGIALCTMQNREGVVTLDKFFLKLSSPGNKALQAAGLLPKKKKN